MDIRINIEDYLTPEEIKCECKEALRNAVYSQYHRNERELDRLLTNLSYHYVWDMVNNAIDGNLETVIKEKVTKIIDELSSYSVFRGKDNYGYAESKGHKIMEEEVERQREHIKLRIYEVIEQYDYQGIKNRISDMIYECIDEKLFGNSNT